MNDKIVEVFSTRAADFFYIHNLQSSFYRDYILLILTVMIRLPYYADPNHVSLHSDLDTGGFPY